MRERLSSIPGVGRLSAVVHQSYRRKLAAALLIVTLIGTVAALGLYVQVGSLLSEDVEQSMTAAADSEANELTEWTNQNRLVALLLSEHPVYGSDNRSEIRTHLQSQRGEDERTQIVDAHVIDRQNQTVAISTNQQTEANSLREFPLENRFAFEGFDDARLTRPYESRRGPIVVTFITPIREKPGQLLAVSIDATSLFERFEHPVEGGFTRVVDSNGTVVLADDQSAMLEQYQNAPTRASIVSRGLQGESGYTDELPYDLVVGSADEHVAAYAPVEGADWVVIEHAPASQAYAIAEETRAWIGLTLVLLLSGFLGVVAVVGTDITRALSRLSDRAARISDDEYDVTFDTGRADEFGDLNRTFAETRDTLRDRIEEIRETRDELEKTNETLEQRSTMVSVLNRILRHNVRNDVNVIAGRASSLAEDVDDEHVESELAIIEETAWQLAELSSRTRHLKQLLSEKRVERRPIDIEADLSPLFTDIEATYRATTITLHVSADLPAIDALSTLPVAITDVLERIIEHNDEEVTIDVTARQQSDDTVELVIDDDGQGLPTLDIEAVDGGRETALRHAKGLSLWSLRWTVDSSGGELTVDRNDATLIVRLPVATPR